MTTSCCQTPRPLTNIDAHRDLTTFQPSNLAFSHVTKRRLHVDRAMNGCDANRNVALSLDE
jgi:hypothetical protein